jgi:hypothetical protein
MRTTGWKQHGCARRGSNDRWSVGRPLVLADSRDAEQALVWIRALYQCSCCGCDCS